VTTYSKRDRERAVEALMAIAANRQTKLNPKPWNFFDLPSDAPVRLVDAAYEAANPDEMYRVDAASEHTYAATASLLHAGWSPDWESTPPKRARGRGRGR
jgi:hypothetical protein